MKSILKAVITGRILKKGLHFLKMQINLGKYRKGEREKWTRQEAIISVSDKTGIIEFMKIVEIWLPDYFYRWKC